MRAKLENIKKQGDNSSVSCYKVVVPSFDFHWHYHPEFELTYIIKGSGKRIVGDSIENFNEGDLVLLGPNLPHSWVSAKPKQGKCEAIVIQFSTLFIAPFMALPEMKRANELLNKADHGIHFLKDKNMDFKSYVETIHSSNDLSRLTGIINFLDYLTEHKMKILGSRKFAQARSAESEKRINKVLKYIQNNFTSQLNLKHAANTVHLSESAFCKYFKRTMGKTFSDYANEIRIAHACTMLIETDKQINTIAVESGFENLAYFNRVFLRKKKKQPKNFRRM